MTPNDIPHITAAIAAAASVSPRARKQIMLELLDVVEHPLDLRLEFRELLTALGGR